ncbi:MAG: LemA family protein [Oscillospiraceae bacterium]|nr:LemA family protein [Oscillospiraceae bacterium]
MMKKLRPLYIVLIVVAVLAVVIFGMTVGSYNNLVSLETNVSSAQADIQTQLQRRTDLIPNLVNTVKGYAKHEEQIMKDVSDARAKLAGAQSLGEQAQANNEMSSALGRLIAIAENYPDLKANQNFIALQDQLEGTENRIATSRKDYNDSVQKYNKKIRSFPTNIFAGIFGFEKAQLFQATEGSDKTPDVSF